MSETFQVSKHVNVPAATAFAVAADVACYKDFLPLVTRSTVRGAQQVDGAGKNFRAELVIAYETLGLREAFVSRVSADSAAKIVTADSSDGPFKTLRAIWTINEKEQGAEVSLSVSYQLASGLIQSVVKRMLPRAADQVLAAFEKRALELSRAQAASKIKEL